jgi:hypothetical protein
MKAQDERKSMEKILQNEINRQEYMEVRYKSIDEDSTSPETEDVTEERQDRSERDDHELKYMEDGFPNERTKILEELGLLITNSDNSEKK